jgi:hypothetical protein
VFGDIFPSFYRDHFFDSEQGTRRHGKVSTDRITLQKDAFGLCWYRIGKDDSKLLPTTKLDYKTLNGQFGSRE